jgi:hypothetical protein
MKRIITLFAFVVLFTNFSYSQFVERIVLGQTGYNEGIAAVEASNGHFIVLGSIYTGGANNSFNFSLTELDQNGNTIQSILGSSVTAIPLAMNITNTGEILVTGYYRASTTDNDIFIAKFTPDLNLIWFKRYGVTGGNDYGNSIFQLNNDKYVLTGTTAISGAAKPSITYLDTAGTILSEFHLNTNQFASPYYKASYLGDGRFSFNRLANLTCIVDTNNTILSNPSTAMGIYSIDSYKDFDGNTVIMSAGDFGGPTGGSLVVTRYDSTLSSVLMNKKYKLSGNNLNGVKITTDYQQQFGNYVIAANAESLSNGYTSALFFKVDQSGLIYWVNKYLPTGYVQSKFNSFIKTSDGGYLLVGYVGGSSSTNIFVVKTDSAGITCNMSNIALTSTTVTQISSTPHAVNAGTTNVLTQVNNVFNAATNTGSIICTSVSSLQDNDQIELNVYPNPMSDLLNIEVAKADEYILKVYTATGQLLNNTEFKNNYQLNTSNYDAGFYLLRIEDKNGNVQALRKLIKP